MSAPPGWGSWEAAAVNALAHPPSGLALRLTLRDGTGACRDDFSWRDGLGRLGPHSGNGAYGRLTLGGGEALVESEFAGGEVLVWRLAPLPGGGASGIVVQVGAAWGRQARVWRAGGRLHAVCADERWTVMAHTGGPASDANGWDSLSPNVAAPADLAVPPGAELLIAAIPAGQAACSVAAARRHLEAARATHEAARLRSDGWLGDAVDGISQVVAWNTIWEPGAGRVCTPVSRDWCRGGAHPWGSYVLFAWDTFFCALLAAPERPELAAANVRAMLAAQAADGMVPNYASELLTCADHSQPPVGAYCVLRLYRGAALGDAGQSEGSLGRTFLAEVFPALLRWHRWWPAARDGNGDGLLEWGSTPIPAQPWTGNLQAAIFESGLDNSPLYDGAALCDMSHTMELADVGLNALYALDAWALSELAAELGESALAVELAAEHRAMGERINRELWDEASGVYRNRRWDGAFAPQLAPTSFYPLLTGLVPPERAARMLGEHLLHPDRFWGPQPLPSIARNSPAYADQTYWRGRVWGPMNWLVGEGLRRAGFAQAGRALARASLNLFLGEWRAEGHIHENYHAESGDGDDVPNSDPLYTWGALLPFLAVQELVDCAPWAGWSFGTGDGEPASIDGLRLAEGRLAVASSPAGLTVTLDGALRLALDVPARVSAYRERADGRSFVVEAPAQRAGTVRLTVGGLPAHREIRLAAAEPSSMRSDNAGQITVHLTLPASVNLYW